MHKYACLYRPPSWASLPSGWTLLERPLILPNNFERRIDLPVSEYQYGVIGFASPLSSADREHYGLQYLGVA